MPRNAVARLAMTLSLAVAGSACSDGDGGGRAAEMTSTAEAAAGSLADYGDAVTAAYRPLTAQLQALMAGTGGREAFRAAEAEAEATLARLVALTVPVGGEPAARAYRAAAELFGAFASTGSAAAGLAEGDLRSQVDLLALRLRVLGDRLYDRGRAAIDPEVLDVADEGITLPDEVPDWAASGVAAGPPLGPPPPPAGDPPLRQAERPEQPEAGWLTAVADAGVPPARALGAAVAAGDAATLAELSGQFVAAAEELRPVPDPVPGGRERSAVARLRLLVYAEAARAAQAAALVPTAAVQDSLVAVARRAAMVADRLNDPGLPDWNSGLSG